jgi:L-asparaginase
MSPGQPKRRVALIGTGGTISSIGRDSLDVWEYMDAGKKIGPDDLVARYPETAQVAEIVPVPFSSVGSSFIGPADWLLLTETVDALVAREAPLDGVVITHGTATLEETAYFLNLAVRVDLTVVVVGAQRPATGLSSDAGMNLVSAFRVAAAPEARGLGVLVVLNDEIQAAREVTKTSTLRLETFRSADLGMLGYADPDGRVAIYRRPARRHTPGTEFDMRGRHRVLLCRRRPHRHRRLRCGGRARHRGGVARARHDDRRGERGPARRPKKGRAGGAVEPCRQRARAPAHAAARAGLRRGR